MRNISTPVHTVFWVGRIPTISTSSPIWTMPCSTRPVTTVPRPVIENTSSMAIMNGLSMSRSGSGMYSSTAAINSNTWAAASASPSSAFSADTRTTGTSSPGNSYSDSNSRTSNSTRSNSSSSSTVSTLFNATTIDGTPTWRANNTCSRVWGIGPSAADTTRIAPSTCAAPVIMFLM